MPRIIVKSKYLKSGKHRSFYTKYMATREDAEMISASYGKAEATAKQKEMIQSMLKDLPTVKDLFEYEDYIAKPNRENASELISAVLEHNMEQIANKENYVDYIANRPRVEKLGEHGLFSDSDDIIDLNRTAQEVASHSGYVWTNIISIKREDAQRLGYDNANEWKNLCRAKRNELAEAMKIEPANLRWYAAFHNEGHHPHIHMIVYSADEKQGYLTKEGIRKIRSMYAGTIFKQDLLNLYQGQTSDRDEVKRLSREQIQKLINSLNEPKQELDKMELLIKQLHSEIRNHRGKLVYGFLDAKTKKLVDEIMKLLEKDERIQKLYEEWYLKKEEIQHTYKDSEMVRIPFHMQKEFRSIKNMILQEVRGIAFEEMKDDGIKINCPEDSEWMDEGDAIDFVDSVDPVSNRNGAYKMEWNENYKMAMAYLYGSDEIEKDVQQAVEYLKKEADRSNVLALSDLGKIYQRGIGTEIDEAKADGYYKKAFEGFQTLSDTENSMNEYLSYRIGKCYLYGTGTEKDYENAMQSFEEAGDNKYALYSLGMMYKKGLGTEVSDDGAYQCFYNSAIQDNCYAQYETAKALETGKGVDADPERAEMFYKKAFRNFERMEKENGDDNLQYRLGRMCYEGKGTEQDTEMAVFYLERSVEMKNENSMFLLSQIWIKEGHIDHKDEAEKMLLYLREQEHEAASFLLGREYITGEYFDKDVRKGIEILKEFEDESYAAHYLYRAYMELSDMPMALKYLLQLAESGNDFAQFQYGRYLIEGEAVEKNIEEGIRWLERSAEQNNMFAQYLLGKLFLFGNEVERDEERALRYLESSAQQGNEYAQWMLEHRNDYPHQPMLLLVSRFFYHMGQAFEKEMLPDRNNPLAGIDRKLKRKILEKRSALGHRDDDHSMNAQF